jgi:uncharacterized integral membrane protein (TIGR00697 family)
MKLETKFALMLTVFIAAISILNIISQKVAVLTLGPWVLPFSAGILAYAMTFPITDTITEIWGKERAQMTVWLGFLANLVTLGLATVAIHATPADFWVEQDEGFRAVLEGVPRIIVASLSAYLVAQFHDLWAFHFWKKITGGKHLWLRNNASTFSSQLIDSVIFTTIAFAPLPLLGGTISWSQLPTFVGIYWVLKLIVALLDTPVVYGLVYWCRQSKAPAPHDNPA